MIECQVVAEFVDAFSAKLGSMRSQRILDRSASSLAGIPRE